MAMIHKLGIRARLTLVTLLPMSVLAVTLIVYFTSARITEIEQAHLLRGQALARQLAAASEFGVFAGNSELLQRLANAASREDDVRGVSIEDNEGALLAASGEYPLPDAASRRDSTVAARGDDVRIIEPVRASQLTISDDLSEILAPSGFSNMQQLGVVRIDFSREVLFRKRAELLRNGGLAFVLVLLGGLALARHISRSVSQPIRDIAHSVSRIGHGDFDERVPETGGGSLSRLANGFNEMAARLQDAYRTMERRIDEATAELRTRTDEAERANLAKSRFLAAASHDLRQPMHALVLFIAELAGMRHPPETARLVRQISASAEAMETLLDSLLDISKLDAGVLVPEPRAIELQAVFRRVALDFASMAQEKGLRLRVRPTSAWALSDPVLFERILLNLVGNALRYTPSGTVLIACRPSGAHWRVEVRDSGIGIPPEAHAQIFQEFVQLANPERARHKGLGLGLAIVRRLSELLGHRLQLRSGAGRGSCFALSLPRCDPADQGAAGEERPRPPGSLVGLAIAVVNDDELARAGIVSLLNSWGCDVIAGENLETLQINLALGGLPPRAVICDLRLSGPHNGVDIIAHVRRRYGEELPAVLISGETAAESLQLAQREGIALLHKPLRPAKLRALLHRQLSAAEAAE